MPSAKHIRNAHTRHFSDPHRQSCEVPFPEARNSHPLPLPPPEQHQCCPPGTPNSRLADHHLPDPSPRGVRPDGATGTIPLRRKAPCDRRNRHGCYQDPEGPLGRERPQGELPRLAQAEAEARRAEVLCRARRKDPGRIPHLDRVPGHDQWLFWC